MKEKILKIIVCIIVIIIVAIIIELSYLMIADIETKLPNENSYSCLIDQKKFKNRKVFIITPKEVQKTDITILYFHGGSYMAEATDQHWTFLEKIINDTGATVILPDYPLTPKYHYKDVFNMVEPLYEEIINKINPENLILMGDSAGGGLTLALEESLSNKSILMPSKTILISPWLDVRLENPDIDKVQKYDKDLNKDALKLAGIAYAGGNEEGINSFLVNPIDGDLSKLKNITIFTGTYDILNPDVKILKEKAEKQNVKIDIKEYEGASHVWILKNPKENPKEKDAIINGYEEIIKLIKQKDAGE